jgi:ribosomal-protein-alanine N-acetyltransferase
MPSFPELQEPLRSERAWLRFGTDRDIPEILIAYQDDPGLHVRLGLDRPPSGAELGRGFERARSERASGSSVRFTILLPGSDVCRGQVDVHKVDWDHRRAEVGIWVASGQRGQGLASAALALMARWLFETCAMARVEIFTAPGNLTMVGAAKRAGMREEGVLRAYMRDGEERRDTVVLSLLPSDLEPAS